MRRQIAWLVVATTATVVVCFVIPLCLLVKAMAEDRAKAAADQEARNVAILVAGLSGDDRLPSLITDLDARNTPQTMVRGPDGTWLTGNSDTLDAAMTAEVDKAASGIGRTYVDEHGLRVLLPIVMGEGTAVVRTSVPLAEVREGVGRAWLSIVGVGLALLALALALATWLGRRVSQPLLRVAAVAHELSAGDLTARAEIAGPEETEELARALNGLAERTEELLAAERAAVADLSHRLRTPVTALRLDAESVTEPDLAVRLQEHIGNLQRTIDAVVREARRPVRTDLAASCDAASVVRGRVRYWSPLAEDQGRRMLVDVPRLEFLVPVTADDLADTVDVLIDNVFAHTPEGIGFRVSLQPARSGEEPIATGVTLIIEDDGPGIVETRPRLRTGSTGLGLDIARRTANGCGGSLEIGPTGRVGSNGIGTRVQLNLPLIARL